MFLQMPQQWRKFRQRKAFWDNRGQIQQYEFLRFGKAAD